MRCQHQQRVPARNLQPDQGFKGIWMMSYLAVTAHRSDRQPAANIDADPDATKTEIGLAIRGARRQAYHRHDRNPAVHHDSHIGHALIADAIEIGVEFYPLLDHGLVWHAAQTMHTAKNIGRVVAEVAH